MYPLTRYRGQNCDVYDPAARACDLNPCRNGAKCIPDPMSLYRCECEPGFSGIQCEENTNECYTSPCLNGGQCIDRCLLLLYKNLPKKLVLTSNLSKMKAR